MKNKYRRRLKRELKQIKKQNNQIVYYTAMINTQTKKIKNDSTRNRINILKKVM